MPDDLANYNIAPVSQCVGNRFVGDCAVRGDSGQERLRN
jgi:hypothetical protein